MASKDIRQANQQVEAAVSLQFPQASKADRERIVAIALHYLAQTFSNGAYPARITPRENGKAELDYITIEEIGRRVLGEGWVG
jgi:hypothetical protein